MRFATFYREHQALVVETSAVSTSATATSATEPCLDEALFKSRLVRGSQTVNKSRSNRDGFKSLETDGERKEVRMPALERTRRSRAAFRAALQRAPKMKLIQHKRKQSIARKG